VNADTFQQAVTASRPVVAAVRPEQLDDPTPCRLWKVRDLINHMIDAPTFAAIVMETGDFSNQTDESVDHAAGDYLTDYDAATSRAIASFRAEGAMSKLVKLPFGELPGAGFVNIAISDAFAHGWDLAKATPPPPQWPPAPPTRPRRHPTTPTRRHRPTGPVSPSTPQSRPKWSHLGRELPSRCTGPREGAE
jgi:uncharacterized protein (TIGR03086 family)